MFTLTDIGCFQALNPFYIFQVFSCIVWFLDEYMSYALVIIAMSVISLGAEVYQTRTVSIILTTVMFVYAAFNFYTLSS